MDNERRAYRRRRRRKRRLLQLIPIGVAIMLIAVVFLIGKKQGWFEGFFDSTQKADLYKLSVLKNNLDLSEAWVKVFPTYNLEQLSTNELVGILC